MRWPTADIEPPAKVVFQMTTAWQELPTYEEYLEARLKTEMTSPLFHLFFDLFPFFLFFEETFSSPHDIY
jgi:hypothetical protein